MSKSFHRYGIAHSKYVRRRNSHDYRRQRGPKLRAEERPQKKAMRRKVGVPDFYRADSRMICELCGKTYLKHPLDEAGVLNVLCNGDLVKL